MCKFNPSAKSFVLFSIRGAAKDSIKEVKTGLASCLPDGGYLCRKEFHDKRQGVRKTRGSSCQLNVEDTH